PCLRQGRACLERGLVTLGQVVPLGQVDIEGWRRAALEPTRIVVERCDLVEAKLLVVVGTDPLGGIDGSLLQRRIDVAARELLGYGTQATDDLAGEAEDAVLEPLEIVDRL